MNKSGTVTSQDAGEREIVAVVLARRGLLALLRRSRLVSGDPGAWHCVTGYLEPGQTPRSQAALELIEETGLAGADIDDLVSGPVLYLSDSRGGATWCVHVFNAQVRQWNLRLNWEHSEYQWVAPDCCEAVEPTVEWLPLILAASRGESPEVKSSRFVALSG